MTTSGRTWRARSKIRALPGRGDHVGGSPGTSEPSSAPCTSRPTTQPRSSGDAVSSSRLFSRWRAAPPPDRVHAGLRAEPQHRPQRLRTGLLQRGVGRVARVQHQVDRRAVALRPAGSGPPRRAARRGAGNRPAARSRRHARRAAGCTTAAAGTASATSGASTNRTSPMSCCSPSAAAAAPSTATASCRAVPMTPMLRPGRRRQRDRGRAPGHVHALPDDGERLVDRCAAGPAGARRARVRGCRRTAVVPVAPPTPARRACAGPRPRSPSRWRPGCGRSRCRARCPTRGSARRASGAGAGSRRCPRRAPGGPAAARSAGRTARRSPGDPRTPRCWRRPGWPAPRGCPG